MAGTRSVLLENGTYGESWRSFNSHWYDDWRRHGDICWHCMRLRNLNAFDSIYTCVLSRPLQHLVHISVPPLTLARWPREVRLIIAGTPLTLAGRLSGRTR